MIEIRENVWTIPIQPETWEKTRDICQTDESVRIQIFDIYVLDDQTNIILWDDLAIMLKCGKWNQIMRDKIVNLLSNHGVKFWQMKINGKTCRFRNMFTGLWLKADKDEL